MYKIYKQFLVSVLMVLILGFVGQCKSKSTTTAETDDLEAIDSPNEYYILDAAGNPVSSYKSGDSLSLVDANGDSVLAFTAIDDLDFGAITIASDSKKLLVYFSNDLAKLAISESLTLFVSTTSNDNIVYYCPNATSLNEITDDCSGVIVLSVDEPASSGCTWQNTDKANEDPFEIVCEISTFNGGFLAAESVEAVQIGGTVSGLDGSVTLQNNEGDDLTISSDGDFVFETFLYTGDAYSVTVLQQPENQTCSVSSGNGTVGTNDVVDVAVVCSDLTYTVGGEVLGLTGSVVLQNNGSDDLELTEDGSFVFATALAHSSPYEVTVLTQPDGQNCSITFGVGTIADSNIETVSVDCQTVALSSPNLVIDDVSKDFGDIDFIYAHTTESLGAITFGSSNTAVATITVGGTVTIVGVGTTTITAEQVAYGDYSSDSGTGTLTVNPIDPNLTLNDIEKPSFAPAFELVPSTNSAGSLSYESSNLDVATISGDTVTLTGFGTTTITVSQVANGNYTSDSDTATLTVATYGACDSEPCLHGGTCTVVFPTSYSCACPEGFSGEICELDDSNCNGASETPCLNGGTCVPTAAHGECSCPTCFTGTVCDELSTAPECA